MGLQVSRGVYTEAAEEARLRCATQTFGRDVSRIGLAQGGENRRRAFDGRPRPYLHQYSAEVRRVECGYLKGKSAIQIARKFGGRQKNFTGEHFWARGYFVSTVGLDEHMVRAYIRNQEDEDERYDQMKLAMG